MDVMFWRVRSGSEVHLLTSGFPSVLGLGGWLPGISWAGCHGDFLGVEISDRESLSQAGHCAEDLMWFGRCGWRTHVQGSSVVWSMDHRHCL